MIGRYLVTGGGGLIGSTIARLLLARGDEVVIFDNLSTGQAKNVPTESQFIQGDIFRRDEINSIPSGPYDAVCHLAAQASGEISHDDPSLDIHSNALGTLFLLEWCQKQGIKRFLHASSMAVYGLTERVPVKEDQPPDPYSFYGISKQASEQYVKHFARAGMETTVLRMFNVYGPAQNLSNLKQGMVSIYLAFLAEGVPITVKGSMERYRDFVYIDDVAEAWVAAVNAPISIGQVYNVASGRKTFVHELVPQLIRAWGKDPDTYPVEEEGGTPGDQFGIYADIGKITNEIGWTPRFSLADGLKRMTDWAKTEESSAGPSLNREDS